MCTIARSLKLKMTPLYYEPLILDKQRVGGIVFYKHHFYSLSVLKFNVGFQGWNLQKCLLELQTGKTLIRLLLKKQSYLGVPCLSMLFGQAYRVRNFRKFTIIAKINQELGANFNPL